MYYVALVRDRNPIANSRVLSAYVSGTPTVFFDGGHSAVMGGFPWGSSSSLVPYYEPAIVAAGQRTVPPLDLMTAMDWVTHNTVRVHVAIANGVSANTAPSIPTAPLGDSRVRPGDGYEFETEAADAEDNLLWFQWDWGDGEISDWLGPVEAGTKATAVHAWSADGDYDIRVKTKDPFGEETDWSPASSVTVNCCLGRVGDANGLGGDEPTIGDVSVMIDAKFITGSCPGVVDCYEEADINQSGATDPTCDDVTIGDISTLIDYLFITGSSLGLSDCL